MGDIILTFVGDVMLARKVSEKIKYDHKYPFKETEKILKSSDITFANLESPISNKGSPAINKRIIFKALLKSDKSLEFSGINIVSLANNHILDYGEKALLDTIKTLKRINIKSVGLYYHKKTWNGFSIKRFEVIKRKGVRVGFLAYTSIIPGNFPPTQKRPGVMSTRFFRKAVKQDIKELKKQADVIIVSLHMGREYKINNITKYQFKYAHEAIDAGANVVIGHHPHVLEKTEKYKNSLIFYSLGNFVFDQKEKNHKGVSKSIILKVLFSGKKIKSYKIIPVEIRDSRPVPCGTEIENIF